MRLRMGKDCLSAGTVEGELRDHGAVRRDALEQLRVLRREDEVDARAQHRNRAALGRERPLMRRRVDAARAPPLTTVTPV